MAASSIWQQPGPQQGPIPGADGFGQRVSQYCVPAASQPYYGQAVLHSGPQWLPGQSALEVEQPWSGKFIVGQQPQQYWSESQPPLQQYSCQSDSQPPQQHWPESHAYLQQPPQHFWPDSRPPLQQWPDGQQQWNASQAGLHQSQEPQCGTVNTRACSVTDLPACFQPVFPFRSTSPSEVSASSMSHSLTLVLTPGLTADTSTPCSRTPFRRPTAPKSTWHALFWCILTSWQCRPNLYVHIQVIAAPTGSGKTGVMELAVLGLLAAHVDSSGAFQLRLGMQKVVYLAPNRALVQASSLSQYSSNLHFCNDVLIGLKCTGKGARLACPLWAGTGSQVY